MPDSYIVYSQGLSVWFGIDRLKQQVIVNPHGLEPYQATGLLNRLKALPFRWIFNRLFAKASKVVSLGGQLSAILQKQIGGTDKIVVLSNGVTPKQQLVRRNYGYPITALFVGRFAHNKGIHILMDAIDRIRETDLGPHYRFLIAGTGPLFPVFADNNKRDNVQFLGKVSDDRLAALYQSADVFVFPTLFEGMPTVVLEAMSFGLPVIVSDTGATSVLVSSANGKLIRRGSVKALTDALEWFSLLHEDQREAMGRNAWMRANDEFSWAKVAADHLQLFRALQRV